MKAPARPDAIKHWGKWIVKRSNVHPAPYTAVYSVWEPSSIMGNHSTITTIGGKWYGQLGTKRLPPEIDSIPVGAERSEAVNRHYNEQYGLSYDLIRSSFPEDITAAGCDAVYWYGQIEISEATA